MHPEVPYRVPVCKHPESEISNLVASEHVQQVGRVGKMHVVVATSVRQ